MPSSASYVLMDPEPDLVLRWGSRKKTHRGKARDEINPIKFNGLKQSSPSVSRQILGENEASLLPSPSSSQPSSLHRRKSDLGGAENLANKDRYYPTRGSALVFEENGPANGMLGLDEKGSIVLPRFFISLSTKEKEEDFMRMKGCKLPQRPKKRSKSMQKCLLTVSPGAWLSDLSHERYEVREKKAARKRNRGLKAMCMESESE
ncbi:hypothetical protein LUZ61_009136 [Rhynchospora tenuis]|uniref:Uncharacterized protein n=1 Tax=Rhynchospora tenuis TaxID=198213 RepID=A0AAD6EY07_9POAL|nr:hypothetical protein LUZ61_009136 [Rhynchospora tenuis]